MQDKSEDRIVHESEATRQHVRVQMPARIEVEDHSYEIANLSSAGVGIKGIKSGGKKPGDVFECRLILPFLAFSLDVDLEAEVRHYEDKDKILGCRFVNLTREQTSILNQVIRSFISGDVVTSGDVLNVVARENFVKFRPQATPETSSVKPPPVPAWQHQLVPLLFIAILGVGAFGLIAQTFYKSVLVIETPQAYVQVPRIAIKTPVAGMFGKALKDGVKSVQAGQNLGEVNVQNVYGSANNETIRSVIIKSPCNCVVLSRSVAEGEFVMPGAMLLSLAGIDTRPWIVATVATKQAQRLSIGDTAGIRIAGTDIEVTGKIETLIMNEKTGAVLPTTQGFDPGVEVKVILDQKIPVDLAGRPARVDFKI